MIYTVVNRGGITVKLQDLKHFLSSVFTRNSPPRGDALQYASEEVKRDTDIIRAAVKSDDAKKLKP